MLTVLALVLLWYLLLWAGFALVFASSESAILDSTTLQPVTLLSSRIYFAAMLVFTLGTGMTPFRVSGIEVTLRGAHCKARCVSVSCGSGSGKRLLFGIRDSFVCPVSGTGK